MMTTRRFSLRALSLCAVPLLLAAFALAGQNRLPSLAEADRLYGEKSYTGALKAYETLLVSGRITGERLDEIQYRIAVCLGKTKQWDRALAEGLKFVQERRGTV